MGRSALVVKASELQDVVSKLEAATTYATLGELCDAVSETAWAKNIRNEKHAIRGLSSQMVGIKMKEYKTVCVTKPGQRGRASGTKVNKKSRKEKLDGMNLGDYPTRLLKEVTGQGIPERYKALAEQALCGNVVAACKLQCGACMGYTGAEKACDGQFSGTPCPLYAINRLVYLKRRGFESDDTGFYLLKAVELAQNEVG